MFKDVAQKLDDQLNADNRTSVYNKTTCLFESTLSSSSHFDADGMNPLSRRQNKIGLGGGKFTLWAAIDRY